MECHVFVVPVCAQLFINLFTYIFYSLNICVCVRLTRVYLQLGFCAMNRLSHFQNIPGQAYQFMPNAVPRQDKLRKSPTSQKYVSQIVTQESAPSLDNANSLAKRKGHTSYSAASDRGNSP